MGWIPGSCVYQWSTSEDHGLIAPDGTYRWLVPAAWSNTGFRAPDRGTQGFAKPSWSSDIAYMTNVETRRGEPITYLRWHNEAYPTPLQVQRFAGDQFYRYKGEDTVWYEGPALCRPITYAEWVKAGMSTPEAR